MRLAQTHGFIHRGDRQIDLRREEVIETALLDLGRLADVINADRAVAILPQQFQRGVSMSFCLVSVVAGAWAAAFVKVDDENLSNYTD